MAFFWSAQSGVKQKLLAFAYKGWAIRVAQKKKDVKRETRCLPPPGHPGLPASEADVP
jgi:hypothetical protein